jgi:hypothetical protein
MPRIVAAALATCGVVSLALAADTLGTWQPIQAATYKIFSGATVSYSELQLLRTGSCRFSSRPVGERDI